MSQGIKEMKTNFSIFYISKKIEVAKSYGNEPLLDL